MKFNPVKAATSAVSGIGFVAKFIIAFALVQLADCRMIAKSKLEIDSCYDRALNTLGIAGGYQLGFGTLNPALKRPEDSANDDPRPLS